jgi:hypothetical protein
MIQKVKKFLTGTGSSAAQRRTLTEQADPSSDSTELYSEGVQFKIAGNLTILGFYLVLHCKSKTVP